MGFNRFYIMDSDIIKMGYEEVGNNYALSASKKLENVQ